MYHKVGNYKSAVVALSNFIKEYATSPYAEEAHYLRFYSQHKLAKNSIEGKIQEDRFYLAVEFYHTFVDKYPDSKYKKSSEGYYDSIMESLEEIKSKK